MGKGGKGGEGSEPGAWGSSGEGRGAPPILSDSQGLLVTEARSSRRGPAPHPPSHELQIDGFLHSWPAPARQAPPPTAQPAQNTNKDPSRRTEKASPSLTDAGAGWTGLEPRVSRGQASPSWLGS